MLSIIICSVSPEKLKKAKDCIDATIGVEHEFIVIDNNVRKWPLTRAYNEGAKMARFPYLLFVHEDVIFHACDWGNFVIGKLREQDCGVVGYAGTKVMSGSYSGWCQDGDWNVLLLWQGTAAGRTELRASGVTLEHPFEEVVALDGLAMFMRRDLWEEFRFNEESLTGFHCYDVDFTLRVASSGKYHNYVCCSVSALVEHTSEGNLNQGWYADTICMHKTCWKGMLPCSCVPEYDFGSRDFLRRKERVAHYFLRNIIRSGYSEKYLVYKEFVFSHPMTLKHLGHIIGDTFYLLSKSMKK